MLRRAARRRQRLAAPAMILSLVAALAASTSAHASECDTPQSSWLACEDFEAAGRSWSAWFAASPFTECNGCTAGTNDPDRIALLDDTTAAHSGAGSLYLPAAAAAGYRGASLTWRDCVGTKQAGCNLRGHDQLYFRTWVRLAADHQRVHHFLSVGGTRPNAYWESDGNAGCRPNGYRAAGTTVDFDSGNQDHPLFFYTYSPGMTCDRGGYCSGTYAQNICDGCATKEMACTSGLECCWGSIYRPAAPVVLPRGRWVCLELMMKLNTPGQADGEMAFWVDEQLGHRQTGMRWRDVPELQLNKAWLQHYIDTGDATQSNRAWFDDMVVSTAPIGCAALPPTDGGTPPPDAGTPAPDGGNASPDAGTSPPDGGENAVDGGTGKSTVTGCTCEGTGGVSVLLGLALLLLLASSRVHATR